jgi:membrane protease YdiL (CAAX protease family)
MVQFLKRHSLAAGLFLMFAFTWPIDLGTAAYSRGLIKFQIPEILALLVGYGIVIATLLITAIISGRAGVGALLRRFLIWRVRWGWYVVALFLAPALMLMAIALSSVFTRTRPDFSQYFGRQIFGPEISPLVLVLPFFLFSMFTNGEEIGWRGFALPRLQERRSALVASLILGAIWAFWHLPKYWMVGTTLGGGKDLSQFAVDSVKVLAQAILYTWLFNNTKGSLLLMTLFHASWNAAWVFLPMGNVGLAEPVIYWLAALTIVVIAGPARLVRRAITLPEPLAKPSPGHG